MQSFNHTMVKDGDQIHQPVLQQAEKADTHVASQ